MKVDTSDPGLAARVSFAAAWLFNETSAFNAANAERARHDLAPAYGEEVYRYAGYTARAIAEGRCDGNHMMPSCASPDCWQREKGIT